MFTLTEKDVLHKSKASSLSNVRRLQCWGMNLNDVSVLGSASNLEILNLSCNKLQTLSNIKNCCNLQQLYVRKNCISDISELNHLKDLSNLKSVWLAGNPISSLSNYRMTVIGLLPQLHQLDQTVISEEERQLAVRQRNEHNEDQSRVCSAILSLLPLLDQSSLKTVSTSLQSLLKHEE